MGSKDDGKGSSRDLVSFMEGPLRSGGWRTKGNPLSCTISWLSPFLGCDWLFLHFQLHWQLMRIIKLERFRFISDSNDHIFLSF